MGDGHAGTNAGAEFFLTLGEAEIRLLFYVLGQGGIFNLLKVVNQEAVVNLLILLLVGQKMN